jgi:hypothetical protein
VYVEGPNADLLALFDFHLDVARARWILADEQGAESWSSPGGGETGRTIGEFHLDSLGEAFSVK